MRRAASAIYFACNVILIIRLAMFASGKNPPTVRAIPKMSRPIRRAVSPSYLSSLFAISLTATVPSPPNQTIRNNMTTGWRYMFTLTCVSSALLKTTPEINGRNELRYRMFRRSLNECSVTFPKKVAEEILFRDNEDGAALVISASLPNTCWGENEVLNSKCMKGMRGAYQSQQRLSAI